jgi:hypothetical protein
MDGGAKASDLGNAMAIYVFLVKIEELLNKSGARSSSSGSTCEPWKGPMGQAMKFTAETLHADERTVGKIIIQWLQHIKAGKSGVPPPQPRKSGSGWWKKEGSLWQSRFTREAKKLIDENRKGPKKTGTTAGDIVEHLEKTFGEELDKSDDPEAERLIFTEALVRYHLRTELGLRFGRLFAKGPDLNSDAHQASMERFLDLFDAALKLEVKGDAVLVWLDESYINIGEQYLWGWYDPDDEESRNVSGKGSGTRIIALDAIAKGKGRLRNKRCDKIPRGKWPKSTDKFESCLMIWPQGSKKPKVDSNYEDQQADMEEYELNNGEEENDFEAMADEFFHSQSAGVQQAVIKRAIHVAQVQEEQLKNEQVELLYKETESYTSTS